MTVKPSRMGHHDDGAPPGEGDGGWELRVETCRIVRWRGYRTAAFYAHRTGDPPATSLGDQSPAFRWRGAATPDTDEARSAHHELVDRLEKDGWATIGQGRRWYETELARKVMVRSEGVGEEPERGRTEAMPEPAEPKREREPAPWTRSPRPPPPPLPVPTLIARARGLGPSVEEARPTRHVDRWRVAAAAGLTAAIGVLSWVATHPSVVGAVSGFGRSL
jgi:hypothetical protein